MNSRQFRNWLAKQGCTFEAKKSGSGHLVVRRGNAKSELPMHGGSNQLGTGLINKIKKDLGLKREVAMLAYPVVLEPDDNGTLLVTFPDVPEAVTFGEDEGDALKRGADALENMLAARIADDEDVPLPSAAAGRPCVLLSALATAKVLLYRAMREMGVSQEELARRLGWHGSQVERLLDFNHPSRLDQLETALAALGKRLDLTTGDAA